MKFIIRKFVDYFIGDVIRKKDLDHHYNQVAGLWQIQNAMRGLPILKPMRGWAISPDAIAWILADIQERESPVVIEFGSGQSTVILAAALRHCGGRLLSVEHDSEYSKVIQSQVAACGLVDVVTYIAAPLASSKESGGISSYDLSCLPDIKIDLALIDGPPPLICGPDTRFVPLKWAVENMKENASVFLDDSDRLPEQSCIKQILEICPDLKTTYRFSEKGLVEFRRA